MVIQKKCNKKNDKKNPKIFHFIWWIPHYRSAIFRKLSENSSIDFEVVAGDNSQVWGGGNVTSAKDAGKIDGIKWRNVNSVRIRGPVFKDYEWQPASIKIIIQENADAVICLGNKSLSNFILRIVCKIKKIPIIEWTHGVTGPESWWKWLIRKNLYVKWADAHLLYGTFAKNWYAAHGINKKRLFVVNNSLDYKEQVSVRNEISQKEIRELRLKLGVVHNDERLLIHSGRLEKQKRLSFLIDALFMLKKQGKKIKLLLIGSGREKNMLIEKARKRGLESSIIFYGSCYEERTLGKLYMTSDLCVVPGVVGLVAMHSLVYGTPILTCDNSSFIHCPEVEAIKDGVTGGFYRDGDVEDCIKNIKKLLYPVPCKNKMSKACMDMIHRYYNPKYQEKVIIQTLNSVLPSNKKINC